MDVMTRKQRSHCMSQIRSKNTKPELVFRKMLSENGIRGYRLHAKLLGRPDVYFPKKKFAVFIHGCFWHGCRKCSKTPKTNSRFWQNKISDNRRRDRRVRLTLKKHGVLALVVWEHEIKKLSEKLIAKVKNSLKLRD